MSDQSTAIRAGLAANLQAAFPAVNVSPYVLSNPTTPFMMIDEGEIEYDEAMGGGLDILAFDICVAVQFTADQSAQIALDAFRDPLAGVKHAVETDRTLGGACDTCRVAKATKPAFRQLEGGPQVLTCEFTVEVDTSRSL